MPINVTDSEMEIKCDGNTGGFPCRHSFTVVSRTLNREKILELAMDKRAGPLLGKMLFAKNAVKN